MGRLFKVNMDIISVHLIVLAVISKYWLFRTLKRLKHLRDAPLKVPKAKSCFRARFAGYWIDVCLHVSPMPLNQIPAEKNDFTLHERYPEVLQTDMLISQRRNCQHEDSIQSPYRYQNTTYLEFQIGKFILQIYKQSLFTGT